MFLLRLLIVSIVQLAMIGLDVFSFFVVIRMLALRWPKAPLLALDQVGKPVTDPLVASVGRAIPCAWTGGFDHRKHVVAAVTCHRVTAVRRR